MTRHRDQIAHIQRSGVGAGRKATPDTWDDDVDLRTCDACGAWFDREDGTVVRWPCEGLVCATCAGLETEAAP